MRGQIDNGLACLAEPFLERRQTTPGRMDPVGVEANRFRQNHGSERSRKPIDPALRLNRVPEHVVHRKSEPAHRLTDELGIIP